MSAIRSKVRIYPDTMYKGKGHPDEDVVEIDTHFNAIINRNVGFSAPTVRMLLDTFENGWIGIDNPANPLQIYFVHQDQLNGWFRSISERLLNQYVRYADNLSEEDKHDRRRATKSAVGYVVNKGNVHLIDALTDSELELLEPYRDSFKKGEIITDKDVDQVFEKLISCDKMSDIVIDGNKNKIAFFTLPPRGLAVFNYIVSKSKKRRSKILSHPANLSEGRLSSTITAVYELPAPDSYQFLNFYYLNKIGWFGPPPLSFWEENKDFLVNINLMEHYPGFIDSGHDSRYYIKIKTELMRKYKIPNSDFFPVERDFSMSIWNDCAEKGNAVIDNALYIINILLKNEHVDIYWFLREIGRGLILDIEKSKDSSLQFEFLVSQLKSLLESDPLFASVFYSHLYDFGRILKLTPKKPGPKTDIRKQAILPFRLPVIHLLRAYGVQHYYDYTAKLLIGLASRTVYSDEPNYKQRQAKFGLTVVDRSPASRSGPLTKGGATLKKEIERLEQYQF